MRHHVTETISDDEKKKYLVTASSGKSIYEVTKNPNKIHLSCKLVCNVCSNTCIHQYVCTCVNNVVKYNKIIQHHLSNKNCLDPNNVTNPRISENTAKEPVVDNLSRDSISKVIISELKHVENFSEADEYYAKGKSFCKDDSFKQFFVKEIACNFKAFSPSKCLKRIAEMKERRGMKPSKGIKLTPEKRLY